MATKKDFFIGASSALGGVLLATLAFVGVSNCSGKSDEKSDADRDVLKKEQVVSKDSLQNKKADTVVLDSLLKKVVDAHTIIINTGDNAKIDVDNTNSNRDVRNTGNNINSGQINSGKGNVNSGNKAAVVPQKPQVVKVPVPVVVRDTVKVPQPVVVPDTAKVSEPSKSDKDTIIIRRKVTVKLVQTYKQNSR